MMEVLSPLWSVCLLNAMSSTDPLVLLLTGSLPIHTLLTFSPEFPASVSQIFLSLLQS